MNLKQKTISFSIIAVTLSIAGYLFLIIPIVSELYLKEVKKNFSFQIENLAHDLERFNDELIHEIESMMLNKEFYLNKSKQKEITTFFQPYNDVNNQPPLTKLELSLKKELREIKSGNSNLQYAYLGYENGAFTSNLNRPKKLSGIYDPREREWYKLAVKNKGKPVTSGVNQSLNKQSNYYITVSQALLNEAEELLGVAVIELKLENFLKHFTEINQFEIGSFAIFQPGNLLKISENGEIELSVGELYNHILIKESLGDFKEGYINYRKLKGKTLLLLEDVEGTKWKMAYIITESEIRALIFRLIFPFILLASFLTLLLIILLTAGINQFIFIPINKIIDLSKKIAEKGEIGEEPSINENNELGFLSNSFKEMAIELKEHKENLEKKIEARTIELNKYSMVVEQSSTIILMTDTSGNLEYVNPRFTEVYGYTKEQAMGQNPRILKSGITPRETFTDLWKTILNGNAWRGVLCNKSKNGELFWEDASIFPVKNSDGKIINFVAVKEDITEKMKSENELKSILSSVSEGIVGVDNNLQIKFMNDSAMKLLQIDKGTVNERKIYEILYSRLIKENKFNIEECPIYKSIQEQTRKVVESDEFIREDGMNINIEYSTVPIINEDGIDGAVIVFRDITAKLAIEREIRESEERFRFSLGSMGAFYWVYDVKQTTIKYDSTVFYEQFGYSEENIPVKFENWLYLLHEKDTEKAMEDLDFYLTGNKLTYESEFRFRKKSGEYNWVLNIGRAIEWNEDGDVAKIAGISLDINERKKSENLLENIFEAIPVPLFVSSLQRNKVLKGNRAIIDFLELDADEVFQINVEDLYVNKDDKIQLIKACREGTRVELRVKHYHTNEERWCIFSGREIKYNQERCLLGSFIDVTELREAKEQAVQATEAKSNFLANMSHEIRTPMNAIIGLNDLLADTNVNSKQMDYIQKIGNSANNLLGIINDILDFSKIEAGKLELENIHFSLDEMLDNLTTIVALKAHAKNLELVFVKKNDVPNELVGDPLRLQQVLLNLVNNAIKFTESGEVALEIDTLDEMWDISKIRFRVIDTGIGMTDEHMKKLFASFSQADESTTRKYGGTGLGLSISKSLVEMMGGEISVSSTYGEGTTFEFYADFPVIQDAEKAYKSQFKSIKNIRVLAVDDNVRVRRAIAEYLNEAVEKLTLLASSRDAIEELKENDYDLLILDYALSELSGLNTWEKIRADLDEDKIPKLILMASYGEQNFEYFTLNAGIDNILFKPLSRRQLIDLILENFSIETFISAKSSVNEDYPLGFDEIRGAKILLVEDNKINQQVAKELLIREEFWVDIAENGNEAIEMVVGKDYDIVLLDLQMPILDGYEAAKIIREEHNIRELPIVALSADAMSGTREKVLQVGMDDYITKPIDKKVLFKALVRWIKPHNRDKNIYENENDDYIVGVSKIKEMLPSIDVKDALKRVSGNIKLYISILTKFRNDYNKFFTELSNLIISGKRSDVLRAVHTLKGTSGNIGAKKLNGILIEVEAVMKDMEIILLESLEEEFKKMKLELDKVLSEVSSLLGVINEVESSEEESVIEISREELLEKLDELRENIDNYNTSSSLIHEKLRKYITNKEELDLYKKIGEYIEEYEFEQALEIYEALIKHYN